MANHRVYGGLVPEKDIEVGYAGGTIVANSFIAVSGTGWIAGADSNTNKQTGWALEAATSGQTFKFTRKPGLLVSVAGALTVNAVAYLAGDQEVDGGSTNDVSVGVVVYTPASTAGLDPENSSNNVIRCHFGDNAQTTHA